MTGSALALVTEFNRLAYELGDLDAAMGLAHDDLIVREAPGLPYDESYVGLEGQRRLVHHVSEIRSFPAGPPAMDLLELSDDLVVARIKGSAVLKRSGIEVDLRVTEWFTLSDGRISEIDVWYFDQVSMFKDRLLAGEPDGDPGCC